ncbi:OmpA family protein [Streptomyces globisporus]|uniref:OmpA family protein n=1 Tax=Streptomyces globisporus TaxID=1908 RepID=UPI0036FC71D5
MVVRRLAPALVGVLLSAGVTSCGDGTPATGKCDWMKKAAKSRAHTVVLVDATASLRGSTGADRGRDHTEAASPYLEKAVKQRNTVSVGAFAGAGDVEWSALGLSADWTWENDNPNNRERREEDATACLKENLAQAQETVPTSGGTDILAAVRSAAAVLGENTDRADAGNGGAGDKGSGNGSGAGGLIVLTDGLSTMGCADLRPARFADDREIDAIADVCSDAAELPQEVPAGVPVTFVGLGRTAGAQPAPTPAQAGWLNRLWLRLCAESRPKQAGAEECHAVDTPVPGSLRRASAPKPPVDPVVRFGAGRSQTYPLHGAALFDPNSAVIRERGLRELTRIAVEVRSSPGAEVQVLGYVDPRGGAGNNLRLSQQRADAVAEVLTAHGVRKVTAYGRGLAGDCPKPVAAGSGASDTDEALQCDRRVDIVVTK